VTLKNNFDISFTYDLMRKMDQAGVRIITQNSEHGPGQQEINLYYKDGLPAADTAFLYKMGAKEIACARLHRHLDDQALHRLQRLGLALPYKPHRQEDRQERLRRPSRRIRPVRAGPEIFGRHAQARQGQHPFHRPDSTATSATGSTPSPPTAPPGAWENRTVGIRVKGCRGQSTHFENHLACGGTNPYLLAVTTLAAGLEGIRSSPDLPAPITDIAYTRDDVPKLPNSLEEAIAEFEKDTDLHAVLDPEFIKLALAVKKFEVETAKARFPDYGTKAFNNRIDPWEWDYYMELV
jgi:glutamine synthetase